MNILGRTKWTHAFGRVVRRLRTAQKLTHNEFTERASIDHSYCRLLETGKRHPSLYVLACIAEALRMQPDELVREVTSEVKKQARAG
jgi:transcriptional regulator with XRE-family HTH domain